MSKVIADTENQTKTENDTPLSLALSSTGHLSFYSDPNNQGSVPGIVADKIQSFFSLGPAIGLLRLGLTNFNIILPPSLFFWQQFSQIFISSACKQTDKEKNLINPSTEKNSSYSVTLPLNDMHQLMATAPFMRGVEHLNEDIIETLWQNLIQALKEEVNSFKGNLQDYLNAYHAAWNTLGKVCFHLAENKTNLTRPFAFLASYTSRLSQSGKIQHLPLGRALEEFSGEDKKTFLLALLLPVQRACEKSDFLKNMVDTGKIFQPLAFEAKDALQFLKDTPLFEAAGIMVRVPNWWNPKKPPRPNITVAIGNEKSSLVGLESLLDFQLHFALPSGENLTPKEFKELLKSQEQLVQVKGQWIQVDGDKLNQVLSHWQSIERQVKENGLSFAQGLRLLAGVPNPQTKDISDETIVEWSTLLEGNYLRETLSHLRHPNQGNEKTLETTLCKHLKTALRPYQVRGVQWLWWLYKLRLGGCLADDMGLGKTVQVLALLLLIKHQKKTLPEPLPHLLVLPASLLDNWQSEINRFAPTLQFWIAHSSVGKEETDIHKTPAFSNIDIVMTTYTTMHRLSWVNEMSWDVVILDEAQAIKNPSTKQALAIKQLKSRVRLALTGTPIENRLLDLWSLFDFIAPGLLGTHRAFANYSKQKNNSTTESNPIQEKNHQTHFFSAVRKLVSPYILRRLKSDKSIISDLPDKTEIQTFCSLTKAQAGLYQQAVNELSTKLEQTNEGIQRRGLVLSYLLRFKQICNHPHQWLGHGEYSPEISGKFIRLQELCETIAEKQEKVLIFTQFREIIPALTLFLTDLFKREGLFLHGQTSIKERAKRVTAFQEEQGPPFFILSLKAGGTGLNLTAANHVIHFDRWWNPAVENQATDRAYRIGQKRNVLVHKFICKGTIEEKIETLISSKKSLSAEIMDGESEAVLTELSDAELLKLVTLDIHRALGEN